MLQKRLAVLVVGLVVGVLAAVIIIWSKGRGQAPYEMGGAANGYESFLKAGTLMGNVQLPTGTNGYADFVATNREALAMVREGLKLRAEAPESAYDVQTVALDKMATFKSLGKAMEIEGKYAEVQGKFGEAANVYLDLVRFGQKAEAGPLIHFLVGLALQNMGLRGLDGLEPKLKGAERARVAAELKALEESRMAFQEIVERERFFMRRNAATPLHYALGLYLTRTPIAKARENHEKHGREMARVAEKYNG